MNVGFDLKGADALKEDGKFGADSQAFAKDIIYGVARNITVRQPLSG